jgi:hypothetical protein
MSGPGVSVRKIDASEKAAMTDKLGRKSMAASVFGDGSF